MGIHSAPFIFSRVTQPFLSAWRSRGIRVLAYMDDFPSADPDRLIQLRNIRYMYEHLIALGWLVQDHKVQGLQEPCSSLEALGTLISFTNHTFSLPDHQISLILDSCNQLLPLHSTPVRTLARLAGLIVASSHCLGPSARIRTKSLYTNIETRLPPSQRGRKGIHQGWFNSVPILPETKRDLRFWISHIRSLNGQPISRAATRRRIDLRVNTDASGGGWGGVIINPTPAPLLVSPPSHIVSGSSPPPAAPHPIQLPGARSSPLRSSIRLIYHFQHSNGSSHGQSWRRPLTWCNLANRSSQSVWWLKLTLYPKGRD